MFVSNISMLNGINTFLLQAPSHFPDDSVAGFVGHAQTHKKQVSHDTAPLMFASVVALTDFQDIRHCFAKLNSVNFLTKME